MGSLVEIRKKELIYWCNYYEGKKHIWSRRLFGMYVNRLLKEGNVTERQFKHIVKYLKYDLKKSDKELWERFDKVIKSKDRIEEYVGNTLDKFLI